MYIARKLESKVRILSDSFPVVMVTGARQVGKTTLLKHIKEDSRKFVSLDIPENRLLAVYEPAAFLAKYSPPVIIDEFQYAPNLLPYIKAYVDENKNAGDFWLTGSQNFAAMKNVSESLAGRVGIVNLYSLSYSEITGALNDEYVAAYDALSARQAQGYSLSKAETFAHIVKGGMPRLYENFTATTQDYFNGYVQTYLTRDIKDLAQVADELAFFKFMQICSGFAAGLLSYTELSKRAGISVAKAKEWISVLVSSGIIILLEPYFANALKRVIKSPKLFFMDSGLLCYLRGIDSAEVLEKSVSSGDVFENYVVSEIYKSFTNVGLRPPLYHFRDANNRKEIDLIIERGGTVYPIEIKEGSNPDSKSIKNFDALSALPSVGSGSVICNATGLYPIKPDIWAVPHWVI